MVFRGRTDTSRHGIAGPCRRDGSRRAASLASGSPQRPARRRTPPPRRPGEARALAAFLRDLPITLDGDTAERAWDTTAGLAERFKLTVYDAAYLELARRRQLPLASLDRDLRDAAAAAGVEVLGVAA